MQPGRQSGDRRDYLRRAATAPCAANAAEHPRSGGSRRRGSYHAAICRHYEIRSTPANFYGDSIHKDGGIARGAAGHRPTASTPSSVTEGSH